MANTNYIDSFEVNGVEIPVRDPGISQWAREPSAPEYTAEDVGAFPAVPGGSAGQVLTKPADGQEWKTPSGAASYYKTFTAAQWTQTDAEATMSIPRSEHGLLGNDVFAQASILSSGAYRKGTWASLETYAMIAADGTITLHTSSAFDGAVLLIG
mgnify:FL=1